VDIPKKIARNVPERRKPHDLESRRRAIYEDSNGFIRPPEVKKRNCLTCDETFMSFSKENRVCPNCKEANNRYACTDTYNYI
jgi:hypothetical protein